MENPEVAAEAVYDSSLENPEVAADGSLQLRSGFAPGPKVPQFQGFLQLGLINIIRQSWHWVRREILLQCGLDQGLCRGTMSKSLHEYT